MHAIVDIQGFKDIKNRIIVKELAILTPENQLQHFIIQPPYKFNDLSPGKQREANWLQRNKHGFKWEDGYLPYHLILSTITPLLQNKIIYMKGREKANWLRNFFDNKIAVYEMEEEMECPKLSYLQFLYNNCQSCLIHTGNCAQENVHLLKNFMENKNKCC